MSRYPANIITKSPATPTGPNPLTGRAPGVWRMEDVAYWLKQGVWPDASADAYWPYTSLLLSTTSLNGAQNNTFLDSSTNNFTITRNGNTTQGSFTPYGSYWSNYFDGSSYLTVANNTALDVWDSGSGSFTVEAWIFATASIGNNVSIVAKAPNNGLSSWSPGWAFQVFNGYLNVNTPGDVRLFNSNTTSVPLNQWVHCALVKSGSTVSIYQNGTRVGTTTNSTAYSNTSDAVAIAVDRNFAGSKLTGYVSNARMVKGTAVYDPTQSTLTVPAAPLTAISGTSLLTCQSNRFRDNSSNAFAITVNGNTSVSRFSPFTLASVNAYSTTANGGSAYFDNNGDYLSVPASSNLSFGLNNFTIEAWVYGSGSFSTDPICESRASGPSTGGYAFLVTSSGNLNVYTAGGFAGASTGTISPGSWNHVALVRSGVGANQTTYYINGVASGTITLASTLTDPATNETKIGGSTTAGENWGGFISNLRIVNGTAVYTSAFTPPTAPLTAITNTQLLLNATNAGIYDATAINDMETVGNAQVSTAQSKFGGSSMYFDGSSDWLYLRGIPTLTFSGSFTVEFWVNFSTVRANNILLAGTSGSTQMYILTKSNSTGLRFGLTNGAEYATGSQTWTAGTWYHVALVRNGTGIKFYVNGVDVTDASSSTSTVFSGDLNIGGNSTLFGATDFLGYIDDLRITNGIARYTANFTPPTQAFPVY